MLCLSRRTGEKIKIGADIVITVLKMQGQTVRLGIDAPTETGIVRLEIEGELEESAEKSQVTIDTDT